MTSPQSSIGFFRQALSRWLAPLARLKRHDELGREQGQTVIRVVICSILLVYLLIQSIRVEPLFIVFIGWSVVALVLTFRDTASSVLRRTTTNVADAGMITYLMIVTGEAGVPMFALYLWITLGNGFRFGLRAMIVSAMLSLAGFSLVLHFSPVWSQLTTFAVGVMVSLIVLPLYSAHLLHNRSTKSTAARGKVAAEQIEQPSTFNDEPVNGVSHALSRERGQAITRLGVSTAVTVYLVISHYPIDSIGAWLLFCLGYLVFSGMTVILALLDKQHSVWRQTAANVADVSAISYLMAATGELGLPLFILYLWVTLGNGFRFGVRAMAVSATLSVIGFSAVIAASDLWQAQPTMAAGIMTGLLVIPGYAAHLIKQLHVARMRAEEASVAKGHFLARMSHELRTPLNGILGTTELLSASKRLSREERTMLDVIRDSVKISMRQIDNVLDFSKIEAGKLLIERIEFDLHDVLNRTVRLARGIASEKNLRLTLRIDPRIPYRLIGDPHHVQEILINLISNAVKFTEKGYVSVEARVMRAGESTVLLRLEIHDTGIGIEAAALHRVFEAFSQEESSTTRRYGGTGLGTTIAKQLAELMDGQIGVTSMKGHGSTFYAEIPFARQTAAGIADRLHGTRILLITKNVTLHDRIDVLTQQWGVSVQAISSAIGAEGLLRRSIRLGNPIHAVLADAQAMLNAGAEHAAEDLLKKAALSFTPVFLICDVAPEESQLRQWGYAAAISYDLPPAVVFNALHASGRPESDADQRGVVRVEPWAWGKPTRQRARLLVADDNRTNLLILRKILETANYEVDTAEDGEQALEMILRGRYKAAVLDMHMPGLDGIGVIKQYRLMNRGARTPVIMLTANATVDAKLESAEAGADAYLTKPATAASIIGTIERLLDDSEVHELGRELDGGRDPGKDVALLDTTLISELDRLCNSPDGVNQVLDEFENESKRLLQAITDAVRSKNHAGFCDLLHALKGNGANVGALRLAHICQETESVGLLEFRREGEALLHRLEDAFAEALKALREFTHTGDAGPAHGSDRS